MKPPIAYRKTAKDREVRMGFQSFKDHQGMAERLRKSLYYGMHPKTDRPSLPMTELAVEFFSKAVPEGLGKVDMDYAATVTRNACISPCSMILAMAYIERLRCRNSDYLMQVSSSDLFLVSMMVASKFLYDEGEDEEVFNDEWAATTNLDSKEINQLERNFLKAIDWRVSMTPDLFENLLYDVEYKIAMEKSKDRGWCTYTDSLVLASRMKTIHCWPFLLDSVIKVVAISSIAYAASAVAMVGAVILARHAALQRTQLTDDVFDETAFMPSSDDAAFIIESSLSYSVENVTGATYIYNDHHIFYTNALFKHHHRPCHFRKSLSSLTADQDDAGLVSSHILGPLSETELTCLPSCLNCLNSSNLDKTYLNSTTEFWNLDYEQFPIIVNNTHSTRLELHVINDVPVSKLLNGEKNDSKSMHVHQAARKTVCFASAGSAF